MPKSCADLEPHIRRDSSHQPADKSSFGPNAMLLPVPSRLVPTTRTQFGATPTTWPGGEDKRINSHKFVTYELFIHSVGLL